MTAARLDDDQREPVGDVLARRGRALRAWLTTIEAAEFLVNTSALSRVGRAQPPQVGDSETMCGAMLVRVLGGDGEVVEAAREAVAGLVAGVEWFAIAEIGARAQARGLVGEAAGASLARDGTEALAVAAALTGAARTGVRAVHRGLALRRVRVVDAAAEGVAVAVGLVADE
jgi:hypothetical protein